MVCICNIMKLFFVLQISYKLKACLNLVWIYVQKNKKGAMFFFYCKNCWHFLILYSKNCYSMTLLMTENTFLYYCWSNLKHNLCIRMIQYTHTHTRQYSTTLQLYCTNIIATDTQTLSYSKTKWLRYSIHQVFMMKKAVQSYKNITTSSYVLFRSSVGSSSLGALVNPTGQPVDKPCASVNL